MSARRVLAFVAALAIVAAFFAWRPHRGGAEPHATDRSPASTAPVRTTSTGDAAVESVVKKSAAPAPEMIARDPEAAARLWRTHAKDVLRAKNRKEFGDEIAHLLELPYDEAWGPLMEKAKTDIRAALAATFIQSHCSGESSRQNQPHGRERPASSYYKDLPDAMKPFIDRIAEMQTRDHDQRVSHCAGVGDTEDLLTMFTDVYMRPDNVDAQIQVAGDNADKGQAIADLRTILAKQDTQRGRFVLGDVLMNSNDAAERAEGRAMLEQLAPADPEAANRLAYCLQDGCGRAEPDLAAARNWEELSAGQGDLLGLSMIEHALAQAGDNAGAWAWSVYALDLALDGCFETFYPSHLQVAAAARTEAQRKAVLTPTEQNAGLAISYAIEGRWEKQAKERLACD